MKIIDNGNISNVKGFYATGISAGLKKSGKKDLALVYSDRKTVASAVFTKNLVKAAPILVSMEQIKNKNTQAVIINSGNANACTGQEGLDNAMKTIEVLSNLLQLDKESILVQSTGVIGVQLNMDTLEKGIHMIVDDIKKNYNETSGKAATEAIMTTDTYPKTVSVEVEIDNKQVTISGMSKGSGMIHPNMGTMLSIVATDANIDKEILDKAFKGIVDETYNMVSVDGDTSTNDMAVVMANGAAENEKITTTDTKSYKVFKEALEYVNRELAILIAQDGEGATKLLEVTVEGSQSLLDARAVAKAVVKSSLVKTAIFGSDANWGRILCAVGYSNANFDVDKVEIYLKSNEDIIQIVEKGLSTDFDEEFATKILSQKKVEIIIKLNDGRCNATAWGCDLGYDYIKINADYRS